MSEADPETAKPAGMGEALPEKVAEMDIADPEVVKPTGRCACPGYGILKSWQGIMEIILRCFIWVSPPLYCRTKQARVRGLACFSAICLLYVAVTEKQLYAFLSCWLPFAPFPYD